MSEDKIPREQEKLGDTGSDKPQDGDQGLGERSPKDLGREFSARAGRPGTAQERLGTENDAISSFTGAHVEGEHVAGGDMNIVYQTVPDAKETVRFAQIPRAALDEVVELFVRPAGYAALAEAVASRRLLFLRADADRGKFMTAKHLLLGCAGVYRLHPRTRLGALTGKALEKDCGYVLVDLPSSAARELTAYDLTNLYGLLEKRNARLIVTVPTGRRFRDAEVTAAVTDLGEVADRMEVLLRHLERRLGDQATDDITDDQAFMALAGEELAKNPSCAHAALLAGYASDAYENKEPLADTVRDRLGALGEAAFTRWAEGLPDLPTQSMALAVAVLAGEAYETVSAAADLLQRRPEAKKPLPSTEAARGTGPYVARKNARLRELRAHVVPSTIRSRHGGTLVDVVRFRDPDFQEKYLRYFWDEYDDARPTLLAWLRRCARHELESVRVRTAVATGVLAAQSFDHVCSLVIEPWARSDDARLRDAAAISLRSAATTKPALLPPIRNMVRTWSLEESPRLRATAARSWRIERDGGGADAALRLLEELSTSDDLHVIDAICDSVSEMWQIEAERVDAAAMLLRWLRNPARKETARLAFLLAAADLVRREGDVTWPALLYLSATDPLRHRQIAALWQDALTAPWLHPAAKEILAEWARTAEKERLVRMSFARLMASAAEGRSASIIVHEAAKWASGAGGAATTSAAVREAVSTGRR
ncbi:hypothetical protein AB0L00_18300 [Actinoallomurus sp. NPDC052308]|uniref:hypothetical protein n=1 Tax=Actinoallomurus sp. NPDC052308 TaxID=3155530 RepID=UPI00343781E6